MGYALFTQLLHLHRVELGARLALVLDGAVERVEEGVERQRRVAGRLGREHRVGEEGQLAQRAARQPSHSSATRSSIIEWRGADADAPSTRSAATCANVGGVAPSSGATDAGQQVAKVGEDGGAAGSWAHDARIW